MHSKVSHANWYENANKQKNSLQRMNDAKRFIVIVYIFSSSAKLDYRFVVQVIRFLCSSRGNERRRKIHTNTYRVFIMRDTEHQTPVRHTLDSLVARITLIALLYSHVQLNCLCSLLFSSLFAFFCYIYLFIYLCVFASIVLMISAPMPKTKTQTTANIQTRKRE